MPFGTKKRLLWVAAALVLGACEAPAPEGAGTQPGRDREASSSRGKSPSAAPMFTVTTFDGNTFSLGAQRGTPVVLNFWESW
jgi:cytochrome oxidase Cu insertion factor (SCO1/SenC/PrrC family)